MINHLQKCDYEVGVGFKGIDNAQYYKLETAFFNVTYIQLLNSIALMIDDYVRKTDSRLSYVECKNFTNGEDIDLSKIYPTAVRKGIIGGQLCMSDVQNFIINVSAIINACEDYKRLDAMNDKEAMQAEAISYNTIREELIKLKEKIE